MNDPREHLCEIAASFHARGYAFGSTGNLSIRTGDRVSITPTGQSLRALRPKNMAVIDLDGKPLNNNKASKEFPFHLAAYRAAGERAGAIVHLHATHSVALSCLESLNEHDPLPVFTPYYLMRVAPLAVLPSSGGIARPRRGRRSGGGRAQFDAAAEPRPDLPRRDAG